MLPMVSFGQNNTFVDSVNYYFEILLRHDRDSVNQYRIENNITDEFGFLRLLNTVTVESNRSLFVNPDEHINYCIEKIHTGSTYYPHAGIYYENFHYRASEVDITSKYSDPKFLAYYLYNKWKTSPKGHFLMMMTDPRWTKGQSWDYETFIVRYKFSYDPRKPKKWVMVATMTVYEKKDRA